MRLRVMIEARVFDEQQFKGCRREYLEVSGANHSVAELHTAFQHSSRDTVLADERLCSPHRQIDSFRSVIDGEQPPRAYLPGPRSGFPACRAV